VAENRRKWPLVDDGPRMNGRGHRERLKVRLKFPCAPNALGFVLVLASANNPVAAWAGQVPPAAAAGGGVVISSEVSADKLRQCLSDLKGANIEFVELGSVSKDGCTVEGAIELDAVLSPFGKVSIPNKPTMACVFARQFTTWVRNVAAPLSLAYMGSKLVAIETGAGLVCRTRYTKPDEKISEHAKGNAIDIAAFRLENGRSLSVKDASASTQIDGVLMKTFRATGCGYFTTILGPGSNEAHKDHLHFDYGMHGNTYNYRICE
jgi:hypothetical protein